MHGRTIIKNARIVNAGKITEGDVLIEGERIARIGTSLPADGAEVIDAAGALLLPGLIDDQVHFREPGLTHKADLYTESRAAAAGGITSFMEMPNTQPAATTIELWEDKMQRGAKSSFVNYSFFLGASNDNLPELMQMDPTRAPGVKIFMGSSTGDLLVDEPEALERIFKELPWLIATHCEDEATIRTNSAAAHNRFGDDVPITEHPFIRSAEACFLSSSLAVGMARKYGTRLHVLHISTARELELFEAGGDLKQKRITCEACVHHLWFTDADYLSRGTRIKWNPAVKTDADRQAIRKALVEDRIDVLATDHAPHTIEEKKRPYFQCPSGAPLVQHALSVLSEGCRQGWLDWPTLVRKYCHAPAQLFGITDRGFVAEGHFADLVLFDPDKAFIVSAPDLLYKCGWSPLEGDTLHGEVLRTWVNGQCVWADGQLIERSAGQALTFAPPY